MREESSRIIAYLSVNGLLEKYAELTDSEKLQFVEKNCGGQLRDIVLSLYETGKLHEKVEDLLINIQKLDKGAQDLIIFSAVLTQAGYQELSEVWLLTELLDYAGAFEDLRATLREHGLSGLVRIDEGDLSIRSPALAEFILKRVFNIETILDVVKRGLFSVDRYFRDENDLIKMAKGLLKFSVYGRIIRNERQNATIEMFYNDCRLLSFAAEDPLFWVQRSICTMNDRQFDISFRFIENAYGLARARRSFDTYQIDNHMARVLLTQAREEGVSPDGSLERDAISLLRGVLARKNDDLYHPLSVMRLYAEIVDKHIHSFSLEQKASLRGSIQIGIQSISKFKQTGRFRNLTELRNRLAASAKALI